MLYAFTMRTRCASTSMVMAFLAKSFTAQVTVITRVSPLRTTLARYAGDLAGNALPFHSGLEMVKLLPVTTGTLRYHTRIHPLVSTDTRNPGELTLAISCARQDPAAATTRRSARQ